MARVKGQNGLVLTVADGIAKDLVGNGKRGFEYVKDEPKKPTKKAASKPSDGDK